jgi:DNA-binding GntR family transcriptional regulator
MDDWSTRWNLVIENVVVASGEKQVEVVGGADGNGTVLRRPVDRACAVPLWVQVAERLESAIRSGELPAGERLPNELVLADRFGVSRPTLRQAVDRLVDQGLLVRRRGVGTTVAGMRFHRPLELTSLFDDLVDSGEEPTTEVLEFKQEAAEGALAAALGVEEGESLVHLRRLRRAGGKPLSVMENWLPEAHCRFKRADLERSGLYSLLRTQGLVPHIAEQTIGARLATAGERRLLDSGERLVVLTMTRTAYSSTGVAIEYGQHCYRADRYSMAMTLMAR